MSQGPSTFGIITTSSLSPISVTTVVRSSSTHGDSRLLTRAQSCVSESSISLPTRIRPSRAASLRSTGTASSKFPSRMSTVGAISGTFATIFSLEKSRKWIIRDGLNGISDGGSGAPIASGLPKSRGFRIKEKAPSRLRANASGSQRRKLSCAAWTVFWRLAGWLAGVADELREPLAWAFAGSPKHFRPLTLFACHRAMHDTPTAEAVDAAFAIELVHNMSLIIDDVLDSSIERRGVATVEYRFGRLPALMTSGYLVADAFDALAEDLFATRRLAELIRRLGAAECLQWRLC